MKRHAQPPGCNCHCGCTIGARGNRMCGSCSNGNHQGHGTK